LPELPGEGGAQARSVIDVPNEVSGERVWPVSASVSSCARSPRLPDSEEENHV